MYDWQSRFKEQKAEFLQRSLERMGAMQQLLTTLERRSGDMGLIRDIGQHFHQLAGSGAIYDMEDLGQLSAQGESIIVDLLQNQREATKIEVDRLKDLRRTISDILEGKDIPQSVQTLTDIPVYRPQPQGKTVLVVDGDQSNLYNLTRLLEDEGLEVRGLRTGSGAREALAKGLPEALVLSLPLVDGPGYDVSQMLRSSPGGQTPPVVILSQKGEFLDKVQAIRAGADAYFDNPGDLSVVSRKLKQLLNRDAPERYHILHVEDDPDQIAYVRSTLESAGYQVTSLMDPTRFETVLLETNPDLILLDVMMGQVNGFELARFVRQNERYIATPIIFLTTQNQLNAHIESARVGGDEHLIKPVAPPLLVAACAGRLERARFIKRLIGHDGLTGVLSVSLFMERAQQLVEQIKRRRFSLVLLLIDVDNMGRINDTYGFKSGDRVLVNLAGLLKATFRQAEIIARRGSDEFAVILQDLQDDELAELATQVVRDFERMEQSDGAQSFHATLSAGAALLDYEMDLKAWLNAAGMALKSARQHGGNRVIKAKPRAGNRSPSY